VTSFGRCVMYRLIGVRTQFQTSLERACMSKSKPISNFTRLIEHAIVAAVVLSATRAEATPLDLITNGRGPGN
jgi:hypothetical protein